MINIAEWQNVRTVQHTHKQSSDNWYTAETKYLKPQIGTNVIGHYVVYA